MKAEELPDFPLAPWELPPDSLEPLVAPATMRWHGTLFGRETNWLVRLVSDNEIIGELFVREENNLDEGSWWFGLCLFGLGLGEAEEEIEANQLMVVENEVKTGAKVPRWRRVHLQDDLGNWGLTVTENSGGLYAAIDKRTSAHFQTDWPFDFALASSAQVHDELLRALNDKNSDLNFARHWLLSSLDEQLALMVAWKRGDEEELRAIMQLTLRALGPTLSLQWSFRPQSQDWFLGQRIDRSWWESIDVDENRFLNVWQTAFQQFFGLMWNTQLAEKHTCVRIGQHDAVLERFQVSVSTPTHHEQLEAARELSLWLDERQARGDLPAATIAQLRDTLR